jgi:hypothetical protein
MGRTSVNLSISCSVSLGASLNWGVAQVASWQSSVRAAERRQGGILYKGARVFELGEETVPNCRTALLLAKLKGPCTVQWAPGLTTVGPWQPEVLSTRY